MCFSSVQSNLFFSPIGARTLVMPVLHCLPVWKVRLHNPDPFKFSLLVVFGRKGTDRLPRAISSCPIYLQADVHDEEGLSLHQQKVTGGQLVTISLVPGTDSDVVLECHLCCPPPWARGKRRCFRPEAAARHSQSATACKDSRKRLFTFFHTIFLVEPESSPGFTRFVEKKNVLPFVKGAIRVHLMLSYNFESRFHENKLQNKTG